MTYKTILAILQTSKDMDRVLDCALPLARRLKSHIIGVHAEPMPIAYTSAVGFPDAEFIQVSSEANERRAAELEASFHQRMKSARIKSSWRAMESFSGDSAVSALAVARCADLVMALQVDPSADDGIHPDLDALLYETGRPALFVPYAGPVGATFARVLVAWNGTRESARAAFDALPLIMDADETEIFTVDADQGEGVLAGSAADLAETLRRHGAHVTVVNQASDGLSVGAMIENRTFEAKADLLVMGAYSHSRLREFLFGGTTRTLMRSMPVATFMSR